MPLLKIDEQGNVVEVDARFNGSVGLGRTAEMVDQGDMTELSLEPNSDNQKIMKDRMALRKLEALSRKNKIKKYAKNVQKEKAKEQARAAYLEKAYNQKKQELYKAQLYQNMSYLLAQQKGGNTEKLAGVAGFGFSADGRQPILSQAAVDWQPILQANVAFGGDAEEWGHDTALGLHSNTHVNKLKLNGLGAVSENMSETKNAVVLNESLSPLDEYILQNFDNGNYVVNFYQVGQPSKAGSQITDDAYKQQVHTRNDQWNTSSEMSKIAAQGWGYSILDNGDDDIQLVKVAYRWGLPIYIPDNPKTIHNLAKTAGVGEQNYYWQYPWSSGATEFRNGATSGRVTFWNALRPVIQAAAREYATHADQYGVWKGRDYSKLSEITALTTPTSVETVAQTKPAQRVMSNFQHPMLRQGLLK